jgi:hypothetical protein
VPEFVESTVKDIDEQLRQLRDEVSRLEAARSALTGGRRRPGRPRASATTATGARATRARATRTRSTRSQATRTRTARRTSTPSRTRSTRGARNTRAAQALELVRQRPGITIPQIAKAMKIQPNYLYRVLPGLASEGQIERNGQGWHPAS